ncbi:MAG TPA: PaaI family thioesterase [Burkholderiales bacterium]
MPGSAPRFWKISHTNSAAVQVAFLDQFADLSAYDGMLPMPHAQVKQKVGVVTPDVLVAEEGITFLRGMLDGRHPRAPYSETMDIDLAEAEEGKVVFVGKPSARFLNPVGSIQGGWAATILDGAMAHCVHTTLKAGENYTTLEMKINFVRPVLPSIERVRCEARVIHRGNRTATSEGYLYDGRGKLLAHGSETCIILPASGS